MEFGTCPWDSFLFKKTMQVCFCSNCHFLLMFGCFSYSQISPINCLCLVCRFCHWVSSQLVLEKSKGGQGQRKLDRLVDASCGIPQFPSSIPLGANFRPEGKKIPSSIPRQSTGLWSSCPTGMRRHCIWVGPGSEIFSVSS